MLGVQSTAITQGISYSVHDALVTSHLTQMTQRCFPFPSSDSRDALPPPSTGNGQYDSIQLHMHVQRSKTSVLERWTKCVCWAVEAKKQQSRWLVRSHYRAACKVDKRMQTWPCWLTSYSFWAEITEVKRRESETEHAEGETMNRVM